MANPRRYNAKFICVMVGVAIGALLVYFYKESNVIEVDKIQERERVVTRIVERPDGSKTTEIIKDSTKTEQHLKKASKKDWTVGVSSSINERVPIYGVQVSRRIIFDLNVGAYAKTDGELGVMVSYSF